MTAAPDPTPWAVRAVLAGEPMRQLHAGGPSGLMGTGAGGSLWALSLTGEAARRIADGIDAATPIARGDGRIASRMADGGLWVWEDASDGGRMRASSSASLSVHAGLPILPLAVVAVVNTRAQKADPSGHRLARFEPDQDSRRLRLLNPAADWAEQSGVSLPGRATLTTVLSESAALAVLLDDGQVVRVGPTA